MTRAKWTTAVLLVCVAAFAPRARAQEGDGEDDKPAKPTAKKRVEAPVVAATSEAVTHALDTVKLDLDLETAALLDVLAGQGERLQVLVAIDPAVRALALKDKLEAGPVELTGATGRAILTAVLAKNGDLAFEVYRGTVFVTTRSSPAKIPPTPELTDAARKSWGKTVDLDFEEASLADVATALSKRSGVAIGVGAKAEGKVTLAAKAFPLGQAVDVVCRMLGLKVARAGDKLELRPRAPGDRSAPADAGSATEQKKSAAEAKKANDVLEKALGDKKVGLDYDEEELSTVLEQIQEKSGIGFVVEKGVDQTKKVTANAHEISVRDALAKVLTSLGYTAEVRDGVLVIRVK